MANAQFMFREKPGSRSPIGGSVLISGNYMINLMVLSWLFGFLSAVLAQVLAMLLAD